TLTEDPALKIASEAQQSPTTLNSASVHSAASVRSASLFVADIGPPPVSMLTLSSPPITALPPSFMLIRFATGCGAMPTLPALFFQQYVSAPNMAVFQPPGHAVLYWMSQYWMNANPVLE